MISRFPGVAVDEEEKKTSRFAGTPAVVSPDVPLEAFPVYGVGEPSQGRSYLDITLGRSGPLESREKQPFTYVDPAKIKEQGNSGVYYWDDPRYGKLSGTFNKDKTKLTISKGIVPNLYGKTGIGTDSDTSKERGLAGYGVGPQADRYQKAFEVSGKGTVMVQPDAVTGRMSFSKDNGETWEYINPPGLDKGDLTSLKGPGTALAPELALGVGGAFAGGAAGHPVAGGVAGETFGAFVGELMRLNQGQKKGMVDLDDMEITMKSLKNAGLSATTALGALGLFKGARFLATPGGKAGIQLDLANLERNLKEIEALQADVAARTGEEFPVELGNTYTGTRQGEYQRAAKVISEAYPEGKLRAGQAQRDRVIEKLDRELGSRSFEDWGRNSQQLSEDIQSRAAAGPRAGVRNVRAATEEAEAANVAAADQLSQLSGGITPQAAHEIIRETVQTGRSNISKSFAPRYQKLTELSGGLSADLKPVRDVGKKWSQILDDDILPSLADEDKILVKDMLNAGAVKADDGSITYKGANLGQVQRALSVLKAERRAMNAGVSAKKDIVAINEAIDAFESVKSNIVKQYPEAADLAKQVDADYRDFKTIVDGSYVGNILKKDANGRYILDDKNAVNRIISSKRNTQEMLDAFGKYSDNFQGSKEALQRGVFADYESKVIDAEGKINWPAHRRYMKAHKDSIGLIFDNVTERNLFENFGATSQILKKRAAQEADVVSKLNKSFNMRLSNWDSSTVFNRIMNESAIKDLKRIRTIAGGSDSRLWNEVKFEAHNRFNGSLKTDGKFNPKKLETALQNRDQVAWMQEMFGQQYVDDVKLLSRMVNANTRDQLDASGNIVYREGTSTPTWIQNLIRSALAPPLSRRGRIYTGASKMQASAGEKWMDRVLSDPKKLRTLTKMRFMGPNSTAFITAANSVFGDEIDWRELMQDAEISKNGGVNAN